MVQQAVSEFCRVATVLLAISIIKRFYFALLAGVDKFAERSAVCLG